MVPDRGTGSHWRLVIAVGFLTLAAASPQQRAAEPQDRTANDVAAALENVAAALNSQDPAVQENNPCDQGDDNRNSDLCAQWKAADAAKRAADASWLFGYIGTVIGLLTLAAAGAAAWYARKAAIHTDEGAAEGKRAANAAEAGLKQAEDTARIQLQPYVFPEAVWLSEPKEDGGRDLCMRLKNYGQTPAMWVDAQLGWSLQEYPINRTPIRHGIEGPPLGTLPPGGTRVVKLGFRVAQHAIDQTRKGHMAFVAYIALGYESRFKSGKQSWSGWYLCEGADIDKGEFRQLTGREPTEET